MLDYSLKGDFLQVPILAQSRNRRQRGTKVFDTRRLKADVGYLLRMLSRSAVLQRLHPLMAVLPRVTLDKKVLVPIFLSRLLRTAQCRQKLVG